MVDPIGEFRRHWAQVAQQHPPFQSACLQGVHLVCSLNHAVYLARQTLFLLGGGLSCPEQPVTGQVSLILGAVLGSPFLLGT